jgi:hypothetical protein
LSADQIVTIGSPIFVNVTGHLLRETCSSASFEVPRPAFRVNKRDETNLVGLADLIPPGIREGIQPPSPVTVLLDGPPSRRLQNLLDDSLRFEKKALSGSRGALELVMSDGGNDFLDRFVEE